MTIGSVSAPPLTHRFAVVYSDGTIFQQHPNDEPLQPRADGSGSSFSDVDLARVRAFFLESGAGEADPTGHVYAVDLQDGSFAIDGTVIRLAQALQELPEGARRELVYFRRNWQDQKTRMSDGELLGRQHRRAHHLGFRVVDANGRELQPALTIEVGHEVFPL